MAMGTYQDCGSTLPDVTGVLNCIANLKADDGGYANQHDVPFGLVPATAAAVTLLRQLEQPLPGELATWLLERVHPEGGFSLRRWLRYLIYSQRRLHFMRSNVCMPTLIRFVNRASILSTPYGQTKGAFTAHGRMIF